MILDMDLFEYAESRGFGELHLKLDPVTKLQAIIAIHSTKLGPALGGCRFIAYESTVDALHDGMRLARAMSYKSAILGLPHGGGKAVLMKRQDMSDRVSYFKAFGRMVNDLNGRYITAVDSGSTIKDMDVIRSETDYVTSVTGHSENTSQFTANGVFLGIQASVYHVFKTKSLKGIRISIQGLGSVGFDLAEQLNAAGAQLFVTDINPEVVKKAVSELKATALSAEQIYQQEVDVFSPCALGAIINNQTISQLKCKIIAGCANNQLKSAKFGKTLQEMGIIYAPDYVINAGGLIYAAGRYDHQPDDIIQTRLESIYNTLLTIYERSERENKPSSAIADTIAEEKLL